MLALAFIFYLLTNLDIFLRFFKQFMILNTAQIV